MRITSLLTVLVCLIAASAFAGSESYYVTALSEPKSTAVSIEKDADYVSVPLTIQSGQKEPNEHFAEIKLAQDVITRRAEAQEGIVVHKGPISLSPKPASKLSSISPYSSSPSSTAQLYILAGLDEETDVYDAATRIRSFLDSISLPGRASCSLGRMELAIDYSMTMELPSTSSGGEE